MATITLRPSVATQSNSEKTTLTNSENIWDGNTGTYAEFKHTQVGTTIYYLWISGFNFSSIPANAVVSEATAKITKRTSNYVSTSTRPKFYRNETSGPEEVELGTFDNNLGQNNYNTISATMTAENFETFKGYGSDAIIGLPIKRSSVVSVATEQICEVYIEVTYTTGGGTNNTRVGNSTPSKFYVGNDNVSKIYQGDNLIYGG